MKKLMQMVGWEKIFLEAVILLTYMFMLVQVLISVEKKLPCWNHSKENEEIHVSNHHSLLSQVYMVVQHGK